MAWLVDSRHKHLANFHSRQRNFICIFATPFFRPASHSVISIRCFLVLEIGESNDWTYFHNLAFRCHSHGRAAYWRNSARKVKQHPCDSCRKTIFTRNQTMAGNDTVTVMFTIQNNRRKKEKKPPESCCECKCGKMRRWSEHVVKETFVPVMSLIIIIY